MIEDWGVQARGSVVILALGVPGCAGNDKAVLHTGI